ncbi:L-type lectin-domain containing receptor kinase IX.1-like [Syzygium oleosum]|uniref:L-type lectin-domain containing receptor kinase IX.1-like n=1 Tax=Syzygium oleosum TaxID=219896 RepID=UPI0011D1F0FC|nr:L-type lectin-domain containing receptor kinase IX.1-like [Syzygium oleosum]
MEFRRVLLLAVSIFSLIIHFAGSATFEKISFAFPPFNSSVISSKGEAAVTGAGNVIQLTLDDPSGAFTSISGWATYSQPMHLWDNNTGNVADFSARFNFTIKSQNGAAFPNHADGMTFFLTPNGSQIPENSSGGYLAIVSELSPFNSSTPVVAVEFDTFYWNSWDPPCIHVGIDINSIASAKNVCADWMEYHIQYGRQLHAEVTYNSSTQNLSVTLAGDYLNYTSLYQPINLKNYLPEWVTFGFSATTGYQFEAHTVNTWEFSSGLLVSDPVVSPPSISDPVVPPQSKPWLMRAFLGLGAFVLLILVPSVALYRYWSKKDRIDRSGEEYDVPSMDEEFDQVSGPKKYSYRELVDATSNFADSRMLGEGVFGRVYEGYLSDANSRVAIKKIRAESKQGIKEYATEVKIISQLRHKNLVQLVGWCHEKKELLLVYELMSNGSLDSHLFDSEAFLTWERRYKIAQDIASALLYLHEGWMQCVIHRDIKPSNIMLDSDSTAKLGDFGLARLVDRAKGSQTTIPAGTVGYMALECVYTGRASKESDMYSFGAVLLEIACGRRLIEPREEGSETQLVMQWVWELYGTGELLHAADPKLGEHFDEMQMERLMIVGLWCTQADPLCRPSIREAVNVLNFDSPLPSLPSQPLVPRVPSAPSHISSYGATTSGEASNSLIELSTLTASSSKQSSVSSSSAMLSNAE